MACSTSMCHTCKASRQGKGMRVATIGLLRAAMICSSCWGASSLSRLARDSCAAAASLKRLLDTQKLYNTCTSDMLPWSFCHAQRHPTPRTQKRLWQADIVDMVQHLFWLCTPDTAAALQTGPTHLRAVAGMTAPRPPQTALRYGYHAPAAGCLHRTCQMLHFKVPLTAFLQSRHERDKVTSL